MSHLPRSSVAIVLGVMALAVPVTSALGADIYPPSVIALNQKPKGDGISITYANVPDKGTLAIFESDTQGRMGKTRVGRVNLDAGDHRNVKVTLSPMPRNGSKLWAVLEQSDGKPFKNQRKDDQSFKVL